MIQIKLTQLWSQLTPCGGDKSYTVSIRQEETLTGINKFPSIWYHTSSYRHIFQWYLDKRWSALVAMKRQHTMFITKSRTTLECHKQHTFCEQQQSKKKYQKKTKQKNLTFLRFTWCASDLNEHPRLAFLNICHIAPDIKILAGIHQPSHVHIPMPMPERAFPISNRPSQHVIQ